MGFFKEFMLNSVNALGEVVTGTIDGLECLIDGDVRGAVDVSFGHYMTAGVLVISPSTLVTTTMAKMDSSLLVPTKQFLDLLYEESCPDLSKADFDIAICVLFLLQQLAPSRTVHGKPLETINNQTLKNFSRFLTHATAAYGRNMLLSPTCYLKGYRNDRQYINSKIGVDLNIVEYVNFSNVADNLKPYPSYYLCVDKDNHEVILAVRGTMSLKDASVDLNCQYKDIRGLKYHQGIYNAAEHLFHDVRKKVKAELKANDGFKLVTCGHSLGGGVASILAILFTGAQTPGGQWVTSNNTVRGREIHCYALEPPASMCSSAARKFRTLISSLCHNNDIIPSLSYGTLQDIKEYARFLKDRGTLGDIIRHIGGMSSKLGNSKTAEAYLETYREMAQSQKLVPPGTVYWVDGDGSFLQVYDPGVTFREPRFVLGLLLDHLPFSVKAALDCCN